MSQESIERFDPAKEWPLISHGLPYPEAIARHLTQTLHCKRPFLIVSKSLSRDPEIVERLKNALDKEKGEKGDSIQLVGIQPGMQSHTYYSEVLDIARRVSEAGADSLVTIGGGSLVDGSKAISLALANDAITNHEALDTLLRASNTLRRHPQHHPTPENTITVHPPHLPIISVPTTLSAGDFNPGGGATNDQTHYKQSFYPPPKFNGERRDSSSSSSSVHVIVLDPLLTTSTPERVWLGTGMRAVDHCVETICSSNPYDDEEGTPSSVRGLKRLVSGLLRTRRAPGDVEARLECLLGAGDSMRASIIHGVHVGGSHGIGHQLGPMGVPHAETTCVCLPAVQKYNATHALASSNSNNNNTPLPTTPDVHAQQSLVLDALWTEPDIAETLTQRGLVRGKADLGDVLDAVIRELGLPRTLDEYGIGRDQFDRIAEQSLKDVCCQWNVVPLERKEQILEILDMCVGGK